MRQWLGRLLLGIGLLVLAASLGLYLLMRGSLPQLDGDSALSGLAASVSVQRDRLGVVTIDAANQLDAMRALGYVHAQERYFEMDLMRRAPAGELSELFGAKAVDLDKRNRVHRLRARVQASLDIATGSQRTALQAYTDGVNAGLAALRVRPWPYLLLRQTPRAWTLDDSILTGLAMYADLQDSDNQTELAAARIRAVVPLRWRHCSTIRAPVGTRRCSGRHKAMPACRMRPRWTYGVYRIRLPHHTRKRRRRAATTSR